MGEMFLLAVDKKRPLLLHGEGDGMECFGVSEASWHMRGRTASVRPKGS